MVNINVLPIKEGFFYQIKYPSFACTAKSFQRIVRKVYTRQFGNPNHGALRLLASLCNCNFMSCHVMICNVMSCSVM